MKILITGAGGLLGAALTERLSLNYEVIGLGREKVDNPAFRKFIISDITDKDKVKEAILNCSPEVIIHAAALSDVDRCEKEAPLAYKTNVVGSENVALAGREIDALFIYISSDYVFDGLSQRPYQETDTPNPINIYARTKLEGEEKVKSILKKYFIIRTAWLYGPQGNSFVEYVRESAKKELNIVNDKFSTPTYTKDLAQAVASFIEIYVKQPRENIYSIYHVTNSGFCSWFEWAQEILKNLEIKDAKLNPISLEKLGLTASRPKMSALDNSRYNNLINQPLRNWADALKDYLKR